MKKTAKTTKIINEFIILFSMFLYFLATNLVNHTIFSDMAIILICFVFLVHIVASDKIEFNSFFYIYGAYIVYQILLLCCGHCYEPLPAIANIKTLVINGIILFVLYNLGCSFSCVDKVIKAYVFASLLALIVTMILCKDTLFVGRMAHAYGEGSVSYYFFGMPIARSSNGVASYCAQSALFSFYLYRKNNKKWYLVFIPFFALGVLLTGSRKGLLMLGVFVVYLLLTSKKISSLQKLLILVSGFIIGYFVMTQIPFVYNVIGKRFMALVGKFFGKDVIEGSIQARGRYKEKAIEIIPKEIIFGYGEGYFLYSYKNVTEINYLEMLVSGGVIGFSIYYLNYLIIIRKYVKTHSRKSEITKLLFLVFAYLIIDELGSVTYLTRTALFPVVLLLSSMKLDKNSIYLNKRCKQIIHYSEYSSNRNSNKLLYK